MGFEIEDSLLLCVMLVHLLACPFTKVEESFNLQAMHDIIYHTTNITQYDHLEFPGVVPRTFLGPLFVSMLASPLVWAAKWFNYNKFATQYIVRFCLGVCVQYGFRQYRKAVTRQYGSSVTWWLTLITASQFHFMFYTTRPLPNIFALAIVLLAMSQWLQQKHRAFICTSGCAIIIFRFETCLLLGTMLLLDLVARKLSVWKVVVCAVPAAVGWLGLTVVVDFLFWRRCLWPEGEVLWYNTALNKSSNWGTSPFLWYFYSVLPRALCASLPLVPLGLYLDRRTGRLLLPAMLFVLLYSVMPHKELRFIIYVFPLLNTVAAVTCSRLWRNRNKSFLQALLALGVVGHLFLNGVASWALLGISHLNYPGGHAIMNLQTMLPNNTDVHVHINVATAQTGVSRFTQLNDKWRYSKTEDLVPGGEEMQKFSHLLIGVTSPEAPEIAPYLKTHAVLAKTDGFSTIEFNPGLPPMIIITEPKIYTLEKIKKAKPETIKKPKPEGTDLPDKITIP